MSQNKKTRGYNAKPITIGRERAEKFSAVEGMRVSVRGAKLLREAQTGRMSSSEVRASARAMIKKK